MTFEEFELKLKAVQTQIETDGDLEVARMLETEALRFVDDNFRMQGYEGNTWKPSTGTILVKTGRLRRGFQSFLSPGEVLLRNDVPYARIHNEGLSGTSQVRAHIRSKQKAVGRGLRQITGKQEVRAHSRNFNMPKRQFAPTVDSPSLVLRQAVNAKLESYIGNLLNNM